jgi:FkbM family methyltransferase
MTLQDLPDDWQHEDIAKAMPLVIHKHLAIDCGAHRGIVTRYLQTQFERVVSIEPSELADEIDGEVIKKAVGHVHGLVSMKHGLHNTGQRHVIEGSDIEMITLDSLNLAPDFIKLDIEGFEYYALQGAQQTINLYHPVIFIEDNGLSSRYGINPMEAIRLLESWGYKLKLKIDQDYVLAW